MTDDLILVPKKKWEYACECRLIVERLKAKLKECKENAGGMEFGLELEKILEVNK